MGTHLGAAQHDTAGGDDGAFTDFGMVQDDAAHADEGHVADFGTVHDHVVPDGHVVADFGHRFLVQCVYNTVVLDVKAVADGDGVNVATQHGIEPDAAVVAHGHVAHDDGTVGQETVFSDFGIKAPYFLDDSHYS